MAQRRWLCWARPDDMRSGGCMRVEQWPAGINADSGIVAVIACKQPVQLHNTQTACYVSTLCWCACRVFAVQV
jgi:hypothetical protein